MGSLLTASLVACTATPDVHDAEVQPNRQQGALGQAAGQLLTTPPSALDWQLFVLPGKRPAAFVPVVVDGRSSLRVEADSSVSILRRRFEPLVAEPGRLSFSWRVAALPAGADLAAVDASDSPVGIVLAFEGDRTRWSPRTHRLSEMSRLLTGEEMPFATLMYVWGSREASGTVVVNPRTDRIRKMVLDSGEQHLGQWRSHVRDVKADFRQAFGEEPGPLRAVALMTDTDNTRSALTAWYGALALQSADASKP